MLFACPLEFIQCLAMPRAKAIEPPWAVNYLLNHPTEWIFIRNARLLFYASIQMALEKLVLKLIKSQTITFFMLSILNTSVIINIDEFY